jgi:SAM-dependent methyltransferase
MTTTTPQPDHRDTVVDQFTRQALAFASAPAIRDEETLRLLVALSGAGPDDTVLDVACGPGLVACAFARVTREVTGIDLTPAMIDLARRLQDEKGLQNLRWRIGDVLPLPFHDGSFTVVVSRYSFHHFEDPRAVLAEMARVCSPGGRVLVADVVASSDPAKAAVYNRMERLRDPSHVRAMPLEEIERLFHAVGLPEPSRTFYRLDVDLEGVLSRSAPVPGGAEEVRRMFLESLEADGLGVGAYLGGEEIRFAYPIAVLVGRR